MDAKQTNVKEAVPAKPQPQAQGVKAESLAPTYTVEEFVKAPKTIGVESPDIIRAAFKVAGKDSATVEEAKKIVETFKKKEVK